MRASFQSHNVWDVCGRFTVGVPPELIEAEFEASGAQYLPLGVKIARYNVAPTQDLVIVKRAVLPKNAEEKRRVLEVARWGLAGAAKMINARQETVFEKQPFASAVRARRCLVPADGFFEWKKLGEGPRALKQPYRFRLAGGELFAMAGIFAKWEAPWGEWMETVSILTTSPNELVAPLHDRMPVILSRDSWDLWLDATIKAREPLEALLLPFPAAKMIAEPVSSKVNDVNNDDASLIEVVEPLKEPEPKPAKPKQLGFDF